MRPSPIQLKHVVYEKIFVCPHASTPLAETKSRDFDFDGVSIRAAVKTGLMHGQRDDPRDFLIRLSISIDNKTGKKAPYDIDIGVIGIFNVLPSLPIERREDLVTVNGASILYGAIRETVLSLTCRFAVGALTLPGMNFEDTAPSVRRGEDKNRALSQVEVRQAKIASSARQKRKAPARQ